MLTLKKNDRRELFKKAMLSHGKRPAPRRTALDEVRPAFAWTTCFLWLAFLIVSGYMLFFSPALKVTSIEVRGESIIPLSEYEVLVTRYLEEKYFGFIPKDNFFLAPTRSIEGKLTDEYPKIARVSLRRVFPAMIQVYIDESPFLLQWCSGGPCYGFRNERVVTLPAVEDPRYDSVRLSVIDQSALLVTAGDVLSIQSYLESLRFFFQEFPTTLSTKIERSALTPSRHSNELTLRTEEGWQVQIATDRPAELSLRALQIFLDEYAKDHPDRSSLAWIDLRVEGKIFFADKAQSSEEAVLKEEKKD